MKKKLEVGIVSIVLSLSSFFFFLTKIDDVPFHTDEAYWVSTGKIIPILLGGRFNDPFWHEYFGFTNFNGAKYIFGGGLFLFGHSESEIGEAKTAPDTFYHWESDGGNVLPKTHILFPLIRDARIISAVFTALSVGLMVVFAFSVFRNMLTAFGSGILLFLHPITWYVGTHAFADGFFLFFILLFLSCATYILRKDYAYHWDKPFILLGLIVGYLMSIKINGGMFLIAFSASFLLKVIMSKKNVDIRISFMLLLKAIVTAMIFFLILHPNLFFFPTYTFPQMIQDRTTITQNHIEYFSLKDPDHVTLSIIDRIRSFVRHTFPLWLAPLFVVGCIHFILKRKELSRIYTFVMFMGFVVFIYLLSYAVFDEIRYFLPILPFIILISTHVFSVTLRKILKAN